MRTRLLKSLCLLLAGLFLSGGTGGIPTPISPYPRNVISLDWLFELNQCTQGVRPCTENTTYLQEHIIETFASEGILHSYGGERDSDLWLGLYDDPPAEDGLVNVYLKTFGDELPQSPILLAHPANPITNIDERINIRFDAHIQGSLDAAVNLIVGLGMYKLDRYSLAQKYLQEAYENNALQEANVNNSEDLQAMILFYMGNCEVVENDLLEAATLYQGALYSQEGEIYFEPAINLAWTYLQLGRDNEAFDLVDKLLELGENPRYSDQFTINVLAKRSQLYALAFRYDEAIADMDAALTLDSDNPLLYVERGQRILLLYEWDRALADFNRALELAPEYADAYYFRGILYASVPEVTDARQSALADFQHYLELAPDGQHAANAAQNIADLQAQLDALEQP